MYCSARVLGNRDGLTDWVDDSFCVMSILVFFHDLSITHIHIAIYTYPPSHYFILIYSPAFSDGCFVRNPSNRLHSEESTDEFQRKLGIETHPESALPLWIGLCSEYGQIYASTKSLPSIYGAVHLCAATFVQIFGIVKKYPGHFLLYYDTNIIPRGIHS